MKSQFAAPARGARSTSTRRGTILAALAISALGLGAARAGEVAGAVKLDGDAPAPRPVDVGKEKKCLELHGNAPIIETDVVKGADGGLKDVFVYVKSGAPKSTQPVPAEHAKLMQKGCQYSPRVQAVRVGQTLDIENTDELIHNVRCLARRNPTFNMGQPNPGIREKIFHKPEPHVKFKCDIHKWMTAWVWVVDNPFYGITDAAGKFAIKDLPAGEYTLGAWHERYGEKEAQAKVAADGSIEVNFAFTPADDKTPASEGGGDAASAAAAEKSEKPS